MTPREMVLAQIHHQETSPIPYTLGFEDGVDEQLDDYYGGPQWRERLTVDFGQNLLGDGEFYQWHPIGHTPFEHGFKPFDVGRWLWEFSQCFHGRFPGCPQAE